MIVLGMDIGGKTRNGFCVMDSKSGSILSTEYIIYDNKGTPLDHRQKLLNQIEFYISVHGLDCMLFEKINLFRGGGVSPLANIVSLCKVQTSIIDKFSNELIISEVPVQTWKSKILGSGKATKDDSINYVKSNYKKVELDIPNPSKKYPDRIDVNHDLADAVCIALYGCRFPDEIKNRKVNYK